MILPREAGHEYDVDHYGGIFYITTNKGAKNFKVVTAPMNDPSEKNWRVFIDHNPAIRINGLTFFANHIVVSEREGGLTQLRVIDPKTKQSTRITTDESDFAISLASNPEFNTSTLRFNYQSMVTPSSVYDYDMTTREKKLLKRQEVLGGYDPAKYEARRVWADGARRHQGPGLDRPPQRHRSRWQGAAPALCVWLVRRVGSADVLVESPEPARSRRHLRQRVYPRRRRDGRGMAGTRQDDEEAEHVHRLHRLRRVSREEPLHVCRNVSSFRAAAPAAFSSAL